MNDKQIMVDNVDVSECKHVRVSTSLFKEKTYVQCSAFFLENEDSYCDCTDNPSCYFKQLRRAEQKLEKIKQLRRAEQKLEKIKKVCNKYFQVLTLEKALENL